MVDEAIRRQWAGQTVTEIVKRVTSPLPPFGSIASLTSTSEVSNDLISPPASEGEKFVQW